VCTLLLEYCINKPTVKMMTLNDKNQPVLFQEKILPTRHHFHCAWERTGLLLTNGHQMLSHLTRNAFEHKNHVLNIKEVAFCVRTLTLTAQLGQKWRRLMEKKNGKTTAVATDPKTLELIAKKKQEKSVAKKTPKDEKVAKKGKDNGGFKLNPNSKANKIRLMFKEKNEWTLKEMTKRSGFKNDDNTRCMMSIFKNPTRTKELLVTEFNKEKQSYSLSK
jgi:hypothetical protein